MRTIIGLSAVFWLLMAITGLMMARAEAHDVATRCDGYSCSTIVCNRTGDRCRRFDGDRRDYDYERRAYRDDSWRDDSWRSRDDYWHYTRGGWRRNCDPENPTCVIPRHHDRYGE